jgi:hypothetical protein
LAFPRIYLGGLFLLSRGVQAGSKGMPGGMPNPFDMGKSKARI